MIRNYLTIALRSLWKSKGFSAINIVGLAVGLATCILILLFVTDELGYDRYNTKADQIYRVDGDIRFGGNHFNLAVAPDPMGPALKRDYPQVMQYVRFRPYDDWFLVRMGDQHIRETRVAYADSTLFSVFTLPMIQGDPTTALVDPHSLVITETMAKKYFNTTDVVGKSLVVDDSINYKVTGVIKDVPSRSHFHYDFFVSMSTNPESRQNRWVSNNFNTYVLLRPGADPRALQSHFDEMTDKYMGAELQQILGTTMADFKKSGNFVHYSLMPLTDIHLHSNKTAELEGNSDMAYVYIFSGAALLVLLIACVNFMNLSTARSSNRAKEVGVRKALGSLRSSLVTQFLTESVLISLISLVLSLILVEVLLGRFNALSGKDIGSFQVFNLRFVLILVAIGLGVGLLAGVYPAFYLSAFKPIKVLKGTLSSGFKSGWLRSTLVVFQFSISIFLIISTIVIYEQLQYIHHKDVGFNREQVLVMLNTGVLGNQSKAFRNEVLQLRGAKDMTMTSFLPTRGDRSDNPLFESPTLNSKEAISAQTWYVDDHYVPTLGMKILKGRNFSEQFPTDSTGIIINEAAAKLIGLKDPVNTTLYTMRTLNGGSDPSNVIPLHVIGVLKDFNFNSLREQVVPMVLFNSGPVGGGCTAIRMDTRDVKGFVNQVQKIWKSMAPSQPFTYSFMDDDFNRLYQSEEQTAGIFISFAVLAIFIACLGLFGLVTYAAEQRSREIGIRKVLGASVNSIVSLLSRDFLGLVGIAALISFPIAGWAMHRWLQDFAYRVSIGWWVFGLAGLLALVIALGTVSFRAIRAALANPVKSLRTE